jgi:DNA helicase-2/ATP-dependent DNA helicase PcrA
VTPSADLVPEAPSILTDEEILKGLNDAQRRAVTHTGGPLMIVAGAGTGKTSTLTKRFEWLVAQGTPAERVLALTYTREAAAELAERIEKALADETDELSVTTFHSLCMEILRDEATAAGLNPFFTVASDGDRVAIMMSRLSEMTFEHEALRGNPAQVLGDLCSAIDRLKEECISPEELADYADAMRADAVDEDAREQAAKLAERARLYAQHDEFLRDAARLDFGGMQYELWKLMASNDAVRARIARRYDHVLVDEFQDTTWVQLELLRLLTMDHGNIAGVGDDDQSIYGFRGASAGSILHFERRFGPATRVELELNYRCAEPIIDAARAVVQMIPDSRRVPKELRAAPTNAPGEVRFWKGENEVAEVQAIVGEIERLISEQNVPPREICVLGASRSKLRKLADRLGAHGVPYEMAERDFFKRFEIRVPLSWLKVLANPTLNEDAWRMLTSNPIKMDSADYAALMRWMRKEKHPHVVSAMRSATRSRQFSPETLDKVKQFVALHDSFAAIFDDVGPGEFMIRLITDIGVKGTVLIEGGRGAHDRLANLAKLQRLAEEFEDNSPGASAREFANYITGMAQAGFAEVSETAESDPDAVRLMTAHGSKGLEFDHVFVPVMDKRTWPGSMKSSQKVPDALVHDPIAVPTSKDEQRELHTEERRRLCHVAMTRARKQLVLSWHEADKRGHDVSPFYAEAMLAVHGEEEVFAERDFEAGDFVHAEMEELRDALMRSISDVGQDLGEMRLDAHAGTPGDFARFGELLKLSALAHRLRHGQTIAEALPEVNDMLTGQMSPAQRSEYSSSDLDDRLLHAERAAAMLDERLTEAQPQLSNYIPTVRNRLRLSASAIGTYQRCPKQYEFETVLKIPTPDQSHLRLGTTVHNVLERFHKDLGEPLSPEATRERLLALLDQATVGGGWGRTDDDRQLLQRARTMLENYAENPMARPEGQVRTETSFTLRLPQTELMKSTPVGGKILEGIQIGGKIDRIDSLPDGSSRVIDYKTGHDKGGPKALQNYVAKEIQLAIYKYAGSKELGIDADELTYIFLENANGTISASATQEHVDEVRATIDEVADKIISLDFTPAPEYQKCKTCPFNHVCPATEA